MQKNIRNEILNYSKGSPLFSLFNQYQAIMGDIYEKPEIKEMFLSFMTELIKDGELKLAKHSKFLEGSPEEQVDLFRKAWPKSYSKDEPDKDIDLLWWICVAPAGAVWLYPDGWEEWT